MRIINSEFLTSVADVSRINQYSIPEIAIVGKSNVGKSSFINFLTNRKNLAKTSSTCGKTRLLNYFNINNGQFHIVDLPGYGYARVSDAEKDNWSQLIEAYLKESKQLKNVFIILDIRHDPTALDVQMLKFLFFYRIPCTIIANKLDKLSKNQIQKRIQEIANFLQLGRDDIIAVSSTNKINLDKVLERLDNILNN